MVANSRPRVSQKEVLSGAQRKLAKRFAPKVKKGGVSEVVYGFQREGRGAKFEVGWDTRRGARTRRETQWMVGRMSRESP